MFIPEDVFENTSEQLSAVITAVLDDDQIAQPATLSEVREAVLASVPTVTIPLNRFSTDDRQQLRDEIDALIEEYGSDALAVRFQRPWASEALQRLIEAALDDYGEPTLAVLFEAAERGLLARLIGSGEIDDDEAQAVIAEMQALIARNGAAALAEDFLGTP